MSEERDKIIETCRTKPEIAADTMIAIQVELRIAEEALLMCRQTCLPDPHNECDIDINWLQGRILGITDILLQK